MQYHITLYSNIETNKILLNKNKYYIIYNINVVTKAPRTLTTYFFVKAHYQTTYNYVHLKRRTEVKDFFQRQCCLP